MWPPTSMKLAFTYKFIFTNKQIHFDEIRSISIVPFEVYGNENKYLLDVFSYTVAVPVLILKHDILIF